MIDQEIYEHFIGWLGKTWFGLPESEHLWIEDKKKAGGAQ
jgi:hypothetical protein